MKRFTFSLLFVLLAVTLQAQQAKYVFYFIGDGMGLNQVNVTEMFLAEQEDGRIGTSPLCFASFPYAGYATSYSATNSITDSSAAGTALATGVKTYNGAIGVNPDKEPVESVAVKAKRSGKRVGVTTSVSIDHATPSAFYAHQENRSWYYEIALDLPKAGFDFYGGSGFLKPERTHDKKKAPSIYPI
ncbi:MAG: alkaline phosphatase, partial [Bacteroides sp.]